MCEFGVRDAVTSMLSDGASITLICRGGMNILHMSSAYKPKFRMKGLIFQSGVMRLIHVFAHHVMLSTLCSAYDAVWQALQGNGVMSLTKEFSWHAVDTGSCEKENSVLKNHRRGAQTAFILFSTFLDLRPVSAAHDLQTSINSRLEIRISKSKTPI
jgi:hypothetical protein